MSINREEYPHHTHEQIIGYLRDAHKLVMKANIPKEFHVVAFELACQRLAEKQIVMEKMVPAGMVLPGNAQH